MTPEAICPKCEIMYSGWSLEHKAQYCEKCGTELEVKLEGDMEATPDKSVAVINIAPADDLSVRILREEITKLSNYATFRAITCDADLIPAAEDLALIAWMKWALKKKQDEYVKPIKAHLDKVQSVFKDLLACLDDIDKTNREKIAAYRAEQLRRLVT